MPISKTRLTISFFKSNPDPPGINELIAVLVLTNYMLKFSAKYKHIYPVLCPKLTLIQPMWSAYPYHLVFLIWYPYSLVFLIWCPNARTSLYGNTANCSGYGVAMCCYGLFIVTRTAIVTSQYDPLLFHGIRADVSETPNNALTTRMHGDYRPSIDRFFVGFNAICYTILRNNPHIYWRTQL